ncbi:MAG: amidohydrolase, partial [Cytophagales bacterium]|nr:amidohydrolase [Cytophagales bacterium]
MKLNLLYGLALTFLLGSSVSFAQTTYPANDVATPRSGYYAFINAKIYKDAKTILNSATLIIKQGKIEAVGINLPLPKDVIVIDCKGKSIYPSFIDIYSDYGMNQVQPSMTTYRSPSQMLSNTKGPYSWNQALKTEVLHVKNFSVNDARAK